jgi:hypothetical protein
LKATQPDDGLYKKPKHVDEVSLNAVVVFDCYCINAQQDEQDEDERSGHTGLELGRIVWHDVSNCKWTRDLESGKSDLTKTARGHADRTDCVKSRDLWRAVADAITDSEFGIQLSDYHSAIYTGEVSLQSQMYMAQ